MSALALSRTSNLRHHVDQGAIWLDKCDGGANTVALSYAAFEFRLAIERLAVHYWAQLLNRRPKAEDLYNIRSFERVRKRILELAGHQKEINKHFDFMQVVFDLLEINIRMVAPNVGQLHRHWKECSELCHIGWTLSCSVPELRTQSVKVMQETRETLLDLLNSQNAWPIIHDSAFANLRDQFVAGLATSADVRVYLEKTGLWTKLEYKDGRPSMFLGKAIPPNDGTQSD